MTTGRICAIFAVFLFYACFLSARSYGAADNVAPVSAEKEKAIDAAPAGRAEDQCEKGRISLNQKRPEGPRSAQKYDLMDDVMPISVDKEKAIGASVAKQVEKQYEGVDDPLVQKRFEELGKRLAPACHRQGFIYHFKVLKAGEGEREDYYNAFALPGGYVYMFEPLVEFMETDDKIAGIIAHELGHINARHSVKRLQGVLGINALMLLAATVSQNGQTVAETNEAIGQLMMAYSRNDEFEADRLSVEYTRAAGFNPQGVLESLLSLKKWRKEAKDRKYAYFKSHPYLSERISRVRSAIRGYTDFDSYINLPETSNNF